MSDVPYLEYHEPCSMVSDDKLHVIRTAEGVLLRTYSSINQRGSGPGVMIKGKALDRLLIALEPYLLERMRVKDNVV